MSSTHSSIQNITPEQAHRLLNSDSCTVVKEHGWYGKRCIIDHGGKKYRLDMLAKTLSQSLEGLGNTASYDDSIINDSKILLKLYSDNPRTFNVFGENRHRAKIRKTISVLQASSPLTSKKTSSIFPRFFSSQRPGSTRDVGEKPIDVLRQEAYDPELLVSRRNLDHKTLSPVEVVAESCQAKELAQMQFEREEPGNFDEHFELINSDKYTVTTKADAKKLNKAIQLITRDNTNGFSLNGHEIKLQSTIEKLIEATKALPHDPSSRESCKLCHDMLSKLETLLVSDVDTVDLHLSIQTAKQDMERRLLNSLSLDQKIRIATDFLEIKKLTEQLQTPSDENDQEQILDNIKMLQRKIIAQVFGGIDFRFDPEDTDGRLANMTEEVKTNLAPERTTRDTIREQLTNIRQMPNTNISDLLKQYALLLSIKTYLEMSEDNSADMSRVQEALRAIENRLSEIPPEDLKIFIENSDQRWSFIDSKLQQPVDTDVSESDKAIIVKTVFDGNSFNSNPQSAVGNISPTAETLYQKILVARELRSIPDEIEVEDNTTEELAPVPIDIPPFTEESIKAFLDPLIDAAVTAPDKPTGKAVYSHDSRDLGRHHVAFCATQGVNSSRFYMEDEHLATTFSINIQGQTYPVELAGIFDGHGRSFKDGSITAKYVKTYYPSALKSLLEQETSPLTPEKIANALAKTTVLLHESWAKYCDQKMSELDLARENEAVTNAKKQRLMAGTTATILAHIGDNWYTANAGDSRILLITPYNTIQQVTADHSPSTEKDQIEARGGIVDDTGKRFRADPNGDGCSSGRSIGDCYLKVNASDLEAEWTISDQGVNPRSSVQIFSKKQIPAGSRFVLSCDGLYEKNNKKVASAKEVGAYVRDSLESSVTDVSTYIAERAVKAGTQDNLSVGVWEVVY